eukprot:4448098-Pyramimonas_sp.AAC.1
MAQASSGAIAGAARELRHGGHRHARRSFSCIRTLQRPSAGGHPKTTSMSDAGCHQRRGATGAF